MNKKICYITTLPSTLETFCLKSAVYNIEKAGWNITFVSSDDRDFALRLPKKIRFFPITIKRGISLSGFLSVIELFLFFRKEKFDLVQYATSNASCYASIAARLAKVPVRVYCEWGLGYVQLSGRRRWLFETVERFVCKNSTHVRPDSFSNLKIGMNEKLYNASNAKVIRRGSSCGVDLKRFDYGKRDIWRRDIRHELGIPTDAFVFGFAGRFQEDKGLNELLSASIEICDHFDNCYVLFVGDYSTREGIDQALFDHAFKTDRILFCGYRRDIEKYYATIDCTILPSYHEGFPTSIIESQAMGTPAIVTNIPGCIDAIVPDKTGWTIPKQDYGSLIAAMIKVLQLTNLVDFGTSGIRYVRNYYNQEDVFKDILEDREQLLRECNRKG